MRLQDYGTTDSKVENTDTLPSEVGPSGIMQQFHGPRKTETGTSRLQAIRQYIKSCKSQLQHNPAQKRHAHDQANDKKGRNEAAHCNQQDIHGRHFRNQRRHSPKNGLEEVH